MNFLKIAWRDISSIFKNRFIRVSVTAIIIVPLLYSLLYLAAFWDPYSRLKDMPVAVVNLDKGGLKDGENVNYGQDIVDKLKDDKQIGWKFVSKEDADSGVKGKKYYAEFVIPENFSEDILSAKDGKPKQPKILYAANEKRNFLAAQINGKVQLELKDQIAKSITEESTKVAFDSFYEVKDGMQKAADGSKELKDGMVAAKDGSLQLKDGLEKLNGNVPQMMDGVSKLSNGATQLNDGLGTAKTGILTGMTKLDALKAKLAANSQIVGLVNDPNTIKGVKTIMGDASVLKNADTSMLAELPALATPQNLLLINKTVGDVKGIDFNKIKSLTQLPEISTLTSPQNMQNIAKLMKDTESLASVDMKKLAPMIELLNSAPQLNGLISQAEGLANLDMAKLDGMKPLLNQQSAAKLNGLLTNAGKLASIDTSTPEGKQAALLGLSALQVQLKENAKLVAGVQAALTPENLNNVNAMLTQLETMQAGLKTPQTQALIKGVQTSLSPENVAYLKTVLPQLMSMQKDLKDNADNLQAVKVLMQNFNPTDPETKATLGKLQALQTDVKLAQPLIEELQKKLTPDKIAAAPQLVNQLLAMQKDLKNNEKLLEVAQSALTDNNIKMAQGLIAEMPALTDKITELSNGMSLLYDGSLQLKDGLNTLNSKMPELADGAKQLSEGSSDLYDGTVKLADGSKELNDKLTEGSDKINKSLVASSEDMGKFVSAPVAMDEKPINSVKNYGTGFTPYFIPLSLWVGALMMFFVITDKVDDDIKGKASGAAIVAGKFLSYGYIGIMQAGLASIVVMALGLRPKNIIAYFLFNIFMSYVFIAIIQSLIFLLGEVGRLLSIVLLILQLTACAGTFPLEVVPQFFKVLNPFMPFTYCVSALREIISGPDYVILSKDISILAGIMFGFLFISILMKGHADKVQAIIEQRKEEEAAKIM